MKKFLLSILFIVFVIFSSNSQVVDLIGQGIHGENNTQLLLDDYQSIEKVEAHVTIKGLYSLGPDGGALIDNDDTPSSTWQAISGPEYLSNTPDASIGLYSRIFSDVTSPNINATITDEIKFNVHSFYAFVFRKDDNFKFKSYISTTPVFMFHNGSSGAYDYSIDIPAGNGPRNVLVKIPISELDPYLTRNVIIKISSSSGEISQSFSEYTFNKGNSFLLLEYPINNVPGDVTDLIVSIYSPNPSFGEELGDSFFVGGVVVDVEKTDSGCTYTQGYWKNHSTCKKGNGNGPERDETWDKLPGGEAEETIFFLSDQDYCEVFETNSGKGGKYYILGHQYIAAQLNLLNNANPTDVVDAFNEATTFLNDHTPAEVKGNRSLEADCVRLGGILDDFNNGRIGPGHCDDDDDESEVYQELTKIKPKKEVSIYPNPANNSGKIVFTAKQGGTSSVEIYNVNGRKIATLFHGKTKKNDEVVVEFDVNAFKNGLYFTIIKNGTDIYKEKLSIVK